MRRTIQISDKYKDMIEKYELDLSKEEFYILITKLLKVNKELEDKNINIFLLYELIDKYNLDFFSLINIISNHSLNIQNVNIIEKPKEEEKEDKKKEEFKNSPLINLNKTIKPKIEDINNVIKIEDNKEKKNDKENTINKIIEEIPKTKTETETENEDTFYNPILSLGIDLS